MKTIIVAGLGRCGSSLVMQMLAAAGCDMVGTHPDYEDTRTTAEPLSAETLAAIRGKAVKVLNPHRHLKGLRLADALVIWCSRDEWQQAKSMSKFGHLTAGLPEYNRHALRSLAASIRPDSFDSINVLWDFFDAVSMHSVRFEDIINNPHEEAWRIVEYIGQGNVDAMAAVVKKRSSDCYPGLLELDLIEEGL